MTRYNNNERILLNKEMYLGDKCRECGLNETLMRFMIHPNTRKLTLFFCPFVFAKIICMVREKKDIITDLDNFILGLHMGEAMAKGKPPSSIKYTDVNGIHILCAFCFTDSIQYRLKKFRFCHKCWILLGYFAELKSLSDNE